MGKGFIYESAEKYQEIVYKLILNEFNKNGVNAGGFYLVEWTNLDKIFNELKIPNISDYRGYSKFKNDIIVPVVNRFKAEGFGCDIVGSPVGNKTENSVYINIRPKHIKYNSDDIKILPSDTCTENIEINKDEEVKIDMKNEVVKDDITEILSRPASSVSRVAYPNDLMNFVQDYFRENHLKRFLELAKKYKHNVPLTEFKIPVMTVVHNRYPDLVLHSSSWNSVWRLIKLMPEVQEAKQYIVTVPKHYTVIEGQMRIEDAVLPEVNEVNTIKEKIKKPRKKKPKYKRYSVQVDLVYKMSMVSKHRCKFKYNNIIALNEVDAWNEARAIIDAMAGNAKSTSIDFNSKVVEEIGMLG